MKIKGLSFTKLVMAVITLIGGVLVSEQVISGESLASIQAFVGYALGGGGVTALMVISLLANVIPTKTAENIVNQVGVENVNKVFETIDSVMVIVNELKSQVLVLTDQLALEREAKIEAGAYDTVSQTLKDKLNV